MKTRRKLLMVGIVIGALLALGPLWGFLGTAYGMFSSFNQLGGTGISDPRALSQGVALSLWATATGLLLCPFGVVIMCASAIYLSKTNRASSPPPLPPAGTMH